MATASGAAADSGDWSKENEVFMKFVKLSLAGKKGITDADLKQMNSTACKKLVTDCKFPRDVISAIADVELSKHKPKGKLTMPIEKFPAFIEGCAHSLAMRSDPKCKKDDDKVKKNVDSFRAKICSGTTDVKKTKMSTTGNVGSLTDASKYTGSHKERFDAEGKGKGTSGRVEESNATGYVGNYKGAGTFEEKK